MVKVHRTYRRKWWHPSKEITERDWLAMCNFADNGISYQTLAEHFGCCVERVSEELVLTRHYGHRVKSLLVKHDEKPDRADALRTFQQVIRRLDTMKARGEQRTIALDADVYLERRFGPEYVTAENIELVDNKVEDIVAQLNEAGVEDITADLIKSLLGQMIG